MPQGKLGETTTKWAPIAQAFSRTVKAVKRKYDKLANPDKEQRKSRGRATTSGAAAPSHDGAAAAAAAAAQQHHEAMAAHNSMYMGLDANGVPYGPPMTEEQAAAAQAALQANHAMSAEQMAAAAAGYYGWSGYEGGGAGGAEGEAGQGQMMDPMLMQQMAAGQAQYAGAAGAGSLVSPRNDRVFWKADEQQELLRIVQDANYRLQVRGLVVDLRACWEKIGSTSPSHCWEPLPSCTF